MLKSGQRETGVAVALPATDPRVYETTTVPLEQMSPCGAPHGFSGRGHITAKAIVPSPSCAACWRATARSQYARAEQFARVSRAGQRVRDALASQRDAARRSLLAVQVRAEAALAVLNDERLNAAALEDAA